MTYIEQQHQCPYCGGNVSMKDSSIIYGKSFGNVYICENYPKCDAFVGTHKKTNEPLGTLANGKLRELRKKCHAMFDPLWKNGKRSRDDAYGILRHSMGLTRDQCHIAMFDEEQCLKMIVLFQHHQIA